MKNLLLFCIILCASYESALSQSLESLFPEAREIKMNEELIIVKTKQHTPITIRLDHSGQWDEVSGVNLNRGDEFHPGQGMLSLEQVGRKIDLLGKRGFGRWRLVRYQEFGWVYQVNVRSKTRPVFLMINAHSGQLIGQLAQLPPLTTNKQIAKDYQR